MSLSKAQSDYAQRLMPVVSFLEKQFHPDEDLSEAEKLVPEAIRYSPSATRPINLGVDFVGW